MITDFTIEDLKEAIDKRDLPKIKNIITANPALIDEKIPHMTLADTPLTYAIISNRSPEIISYLIENSADVAKKTTFGTNALALMISKYNNSSDKATLILEMIHKMNSMELNQEIKVHSDYLDYEHYKLEEKTTIGHLVVRYFLNQKVIYALVSCGYDRDHKSPDIEYGKSAFQLFLEAVDSTELRWPEANLAGDSSSHWDELD